MIKLDRRAVLSGGAASLALPLRAGAQTSRVLRFIPQSDLAVVDPVLSTSITTMQHAFMVFDTLYGVDEQGQTQPQMVEGHSIETDGLTWLLTLREGLRFHDGTPVLARDVVASIRRWGSRDAFGLSLMAAADEVSAPSDRQVRFRLKRPFLLLPVALGKVGVNTAAIMPERLCATPATTQVTEVVGSGPFRFVPGERVPGALAVYEKFAGYVPRPSGTPSLLAGPKIVHVDRVEWQTVTDPLTAAAALQRGEVDWWEVATPDSLPALRRRGDIAVRVQAFPGYAASLRPNCLQPPFGNPAIRRALMGAIVQTDYMQAAAGDDGALWQAGIGFFHPASPMASRAGMEALRDKLDVDGVKRALEQAGYSGQRTVLMGATDRPIIGAMSEVAADMLRRVGFNLDYQVSDFGTVLARSTSREPVEKRGWSLYVSGYYGSSVISPAPHNWLRGNGAASIAGWPSSPEIERIRNEWFLTSGIDDQKRLAAELQVQAFRDVPYYPLGLIHDVTAYRTALTGIMNGPVLFHNVKKA